VDKLIIESRNILEEGTHIRVSKKAKELVDDIAKRSGRSQYQIVNRMLEFAAERVVIEDEEEK
jgi:hypothetical protein